MRRRQFIVGAITGIASLALKLNGKGFYSAFAEDGGVDDTVQLQAGLNRGGRITLEAGRHYRVSAAAGTRSALIIHSDTFLDLAGSTLELAPSQHHCNLLSTSWDQNTRNIRIVNGEIIGNGTHQPPEIDNRYGISPTFYFPNSDALDLRDLRMRDGYMYAIYARGDDGVVDNVSVDGAIGGGIWLKGDRWKIDGINVRNVTYFDPMNCTGNPIIVSLRDSILGDIRCENYGYGVKFQDGCENVTVNSILAIGGVNNEQYGEFLVKIQGMKDSRGEHLNRGIQINTIVARNGRGAGLYIYASTNVAIKSYLGENNGRLPQVDWKNGADVLIIDADHIHFGSLHIREYKRYGLWMHNNVGQVTADTVKIEDPIESNAVPIVIRPGTASLMIGGKPYVP